MNPLDCAVCETRPGRVRTYDGRLVCKPCSVHRPELMRRARPVPIMDAYESFVGLVVANRERRA